MLRPRIAASRLGKARRLRSRGRARCRSPPRAGGGQLGASQCSTSGGRPTRVSVPAGRLDARAVPGPIERRPSLQGTHVVSMSVVGSDASAVASAVSLVVSPSRSMRRRNVVRAAHECDPRCARPFGLADRLAHRRLAEEVGGRGRNAVCSSAISSAISTNTSPGAWRCSMNRSHQRSPSSPIASPAGRSGSSRSASSGASSPAVGPSSFSDSPVPSVPGSPPAPRGTSAAGRSWRSAKRVSIPCRLPNGSEGCRRT